MVKREFIVERQGRSFVLYAGLLDLAHSQGLKAIRTQLVQLPSDDNGQTAIVYAEVETEKGTFTGIGDANPANVASAMLRCTIRLAETRAKARALRDAVNVGVAAFEELGDEDPTEGVNEAPNGIGHNGNGHDAMAPAVIGSSAAAANGTGGAQRWAQQIATEERISVGGSARPVPVTGPGIATQAQVRAIYSIGRDQHKLTEQEIDQRSVELFGSPPSELSKKQASDFITTLKGGTQK